MKSIVIFNKNHQKYFSALYCDIRDFSLKIVGGKICMPANPINTLSGLILR